MRPYYADESVTIYHGDCEGVLPALGAVDHVITDPPYEAEAHAKGRRASPPKVRSAAWTGDDPAIARPLGFEPITPELRAVAGAEMARLARGWILVFCQVEAAMLWRHAVEPPARYVRTQVWRKPNGAPQFTGDRPGMGYESIVTAWAGDGRSRWNGGGRHGYYEFNTVRGGTGHTTEKPIELMRELVALFSDPGDVILDPFAGSGTTGRAAKDLGRRAILIERDERWCEAAAERMAQAALPLAVQGSF